MSYAQLITVGDTSHVDIAGVTLHKLGYELRVPPRCKVTPAMPTWDLTPHSKAAATSVVHRDPSSCEGLGFRFQVSGFRVQGSGFRV